MESTPAVKDQAPIVGSEVIFIHNKLFAGRFVVRLGISPDGVEAVITSLMRALRGIVDNPDAWRRRGEKGRRHAEPRFSWDASVNRAVDIYRSVVSARSTAASPTEAIF